MIWRRWGYNEFDLEDAVHTLLLAVFSIPSRWASKIVIVPSTSNDMGNISKSPPEIVRFTIFGDQAASAPSILSSLAQCTPRGRLQAEFVDSASEALCKYVNRLPPQSRRYLPAFEHLRDLVRIYLESNGVCHPAVGSVVVCIAQILQMWSCLEQQPGILDDQDGPVVGLCTGGLVAAACAASLGLGDFQQLAIPVTLVSFDIGMQVELAGGLMRGEGASPESWSMAIANITEAEANAMLEKYRTQCQTHDSFSNRLFLSAVTLTGVSVSGPPATLRRLQDYICQSRPDLKPRLLSIYGPYHATHVHHDVDTLTVMQRCDIDSGYLASFPQRRPVISPHTGELIVSRNRNALQLFSITMNDTLCASIRLDSVAAQFVSTIQTKGVVNAHITAIPPSTAYDGIISMLEKTQNVATIVTNVQQMLGSVQTPQGDTVDGRVPLAIVGMSGRFPGAESVEALWQVLESGLDMHRTIPPDRFNISTHVDTTGATKNTISTPYGCFIDNPGHFDPRMFNMSPREAIQTDPMQRLALVTAYEALEMAGFVPNRTPSTGLSRVGTFYGQTSDDYRDTNAAQDIGTHFITGGIRAFAHKLEASNVLISLPDLFLSQGRINYHFKFGGPSYNIDTACSSGLAAIQLACSALWSKECDTAVAGGLSILTSPDLYAGLSRGHFLSPTGSCKTFDNDADGYCRADGIGTVVLKRLDDAKADNDRVLAVILGAATNHSTESVSITRPHAGAQAALFEEILYRTGTDPLDVAYVETHGTGTQAGDGVEMESVTSVLAPVSRSNERKKRPLYVASVKANIGHGEAASGVSALVKAILMFEKEHIPPHVGIKNRLNETFPDLEALGVRIPQSKVPFSKSTKARKILVNNFSAAGGNTALLIEEPPSPTSSSISDPFTLYPVIVSGHTESSLKRNAEHLIEYLSNTSTVRLCDLAYTTTVRRQHHRFRLAVAEKSTDDVQAALRTKLSAPLNTASLQRDSNRQVAFVFTGQGSAYPSLGRELYAHSSQFRQELQAFDSIAHRQGFPTFLPLIDGSVDSLDLLSAVQIQVGLVCIQIALARLWFSWGVQPSAVIGHSLGEYAALHVGGVLSVADAIFLTGNRASLIEQRCKKYTHSMLAVAEPAEPIPPLPDGSEGRVDLACLNSPRETVFSGDNEAISQLEQFQASRGIRCKRLALPYAFHSSQIDPILQEFERLAKNVHFRAPTVPFISAVEGHTLPSNSKIDAEYLVRHSRQTVQFSKALEAAYKEGVLNASTTVLELGPHPICLNMVTATLGEKSLASSLPTLERSKNPWNVAVRTLARLHESGFTINWSELYREFEPGYTLLRLPRYAFDNKNYWIDYRHDWSLRKGDPPLATPRRDGPKHQTLSSSVHRVIKRETISNLEEVITYETDLSEPQLHRALCGHRVNGCALCPSSVYADMALTVAQHVLRDKAPSDDYICRVMNMAVTQPLIIRPVGEDRVLEILAHHNSERRTISVTYESTSATHGEMTTHATCIVDYSLKSNWSYRWTRNLHLVQSRLHHLESLVASGGASKVSNGLAYRLFASLVDYTADYRRMEGVLFSSEELEASATVRLDRRGCDEGFDLSPYWIDSLAHISGFVMNGNDTIDTNEAVYISHGWESMWFRTRFKADASYQTYVKMCHVEKGVVSGDVWILCHGEVAGIIEGLQFQRIPRSVLDFLLPKPSESPAARPLSTPHRRQDPALTIPHAPKCIAKPTALDNATHVKRLIADALGTPETDLSYDDNLAEIGVDSLACLTLSATLWSTLRVDISNIRMMECTTVGELIRLASGSSSPLDTSPVSGDSVSTTDDSEVGKFNTPLSNGPSSSSRVDEFGDAIGLVASTLIQESGIHATDLDPDVELGNLGIDSLVSLTVLGKLRAAGLDLPLDFFQTHRTIREVNRALTTQEPLDPKPTPPSIATIADTESSQVPKAATLIPLQANHNPRRPLRLFLFPDGSGSPAAYAKLGDLHPDFEVYGLVCPYAKDPNSCTIGIEETVRLYLIVIQREQPTGPYHLGGWSVGGVLAFEATKQLHAAGHETRLLLLIDAPCPAVLPPMSKRFIRSLEKRGVLPSAGLQSEVQRRRIISNFQKTVHQLSRYKPSSFISSKPSLQAVIVSAQEGVPPTSETASHEHQPGDAIQRWILQERTDFSGYSGWDQLLPQDRITVTSAAGNHFSMMEQPNVKAVSNIIRNALHSLE
ncbi:hypothetical protein BJX99DRAFT_265554 [Aspergillus californicus]